LSTYFFAFTGVTVRLGGAVSMASVVLATVESLGLLRGRRSFSITDL